MPGGTALANAQTDRLVKTMNELKTAIDDLKDSNVKLHTTINDSNKKWTIVNIILVSIAIIVSSAALINSLRS